MKCFNLLMLMLLGCSASNIWKSRLGCLNAACETSWPDCDAVVYCLDPLVISSIVGAVSKKLLISCGEAQLPQLNNWAPTMRKKLENQMSLHDTIDWLYNKIVKLQKKIDTTPTPNDVELPARTVGNNMGPQPPVKCHNFNRFIQIVDDEEGVDDDDWS